MPFDQHFPEPGYWTDGSIQFTDGWARKEGSGKQAKPIPGLASAVLPSDHWVYQAIDNYVTRSLQKDKTTAPPGERARMDHAAKRIEKAQADPTARQNAIIAAAQRRLRETDKSAGVAPPGWRSLVTIRNIRLLKHIDNWNRFSCLKTLMSTWITMSHQWGQIGWCVPPVSAAPTDLGRAPLLDPTVGEALLFTGTARQTIQDHIAPEGFDPLFYKPRNAPGWQERGEKPDYGGMLGQGTYFTDSFAMAMCYSTCRICGDPDCSCRGATGRKTARTVAVARCLLGTPQLYATFGKKYVADPIGKTFNRSYVTTAEQFRSQAAYPNPADDELEYLNFVLKGFHSVFAQGMHGVNTLASAGCSANQFLIRHRAQTYLEFTVDYVIGRDNSLFSEALLTKLNEWKNERFGLKSDASWNAYEVLAGLVDAHDCLINIPVSEQQLKEAVRYYLHRGNRPLVPGMTYSGWGPQLTENGRLFRKLGELGSTFGV
jgi:hypothetical protein